VSHKLAKHEPAPAKPAIQSGDECAIEAQEFLELNAQVKQIEVERKAAHEKVDQEYDERLRPVVTQRDEKFARVQAWGEANRHDRKTIKLDNGRELRWRTASSAKLIVSGTLEVIIQSLLKRRDWKKFLKVELKKSSLAAHPKVVDQTEGLRLERGEYFSIK
jgi:phage host-nuclease inhibitor protein Gam